jgi:hypothetical protein
VGGLFFAVLALGINLALAYAPETYQVGGLPREPRRPAPDRPYVAPPAPNRWVGDKGQ